MAKDNSGDDIFDEAGSPEENLDDVSWDDVSEELEKAGGGSQSEKQDTAGSATKGSRKESAEFSELKEGNVVTKPNNLDFILDIPLEVTVELGRTNMAIYDLLQLGQGSIIELNKLSGEPLEILINQKLIARGEVVVVNEKFGIRLTDVVSPKERVENLS